MEKLLIIPIVVMSFYLIWFHFKYGMTSSISGTFKGLQRKEKLLFIFTLWLIAFPIMIVGIFKTSTLLSQVLFLIAGAFILLVSVAPMYWKSETLNNRRQAILHYAGSYGGIGIGLIACLLGFTTLSVVLIIGIYGLFVASQMLLKWKFNNYIYWIEVTAILVVIYILFTN